MYFTNQADQGSCLYQRKISYILSNKIYDHIWYEFISSHGYRAEGIGLNLRQNPKASVLLGFHLIWDIAWQNAVLFNSIIMFQFHVVFNMSFFSADRRQCLILPAGVVVHHLGVMVNTRY